MAAGGEHEPGVAAEQLGAAVAVLPGRDVVGDAGDNVGVGVDLGQVDGRAEGADRARVDQVVAHRDVDEVGVQPRRHPGGVGVPEQDVERRRLLAEQVVVDPVVPDQVAGPEPGEHLGERPSVEVAPATRHRLGRGGRRLVDQRGRGAGLGVVQHGDQQGERGQPVLPPGRGQVRRGNAGDDAARADAGDGRAVRPGDPPGGVHRLQDRGDVRVHSPVRVPGIRVPPGDHEHLLALPDEVFDQAAARRQVQRVVLVDRRRHDQQRDLPDLVGRRRVLDQLEHLGPQHHGAGGGGDVPSHLESGGVHHRRDMRCARHVSQQVSAAPQQAQAGGVDRGLRRRRVQQRHIAGSHCLAQVLDHEPHPLGVAPIEVGVGDQVVGGPAGRQVGLQDPVQHGIVGPGRVGETPIPLCGRDRRGPGGDPGDLAAQVDQSAAAGSGTSDQTGRELCGGHRRHEPAQRALRCPDEQRIQRGGLIGEFVGSGERVGDRQGCRHRALNSAGTTISRLRILPVGPLGSESTNHTCRGYL